MALNIPAINLPWTRKTRLQRAQEEMRKVQKDLEARLERLELPTIKREEVGATVEETRRQAAEGFEQVGGQLAVAAGRLGREALKVGRDVGREAGRLGRDVGREAGRLGRQIGKRGRTLSHDLALTSEEGIHQLNSDLRALGKDVGALRITRERRRSSIMPGVALLAGLGTGMAAMYFFDPQHGRRRRALLRDQLVKWSRITGETLDGQVRDLRNRSVGLAHEVRKSVSGATGNGREGEAGAGAGAVAEVTPNASTDLSATDKGGGRSRRRTTAAEHTGAGTTAGRTATAEAAVETASTEPPGGDVSVPEGAEGQPDLQRRD